MVESIKHINNGNCPKCDIIFDAYPNFHVGLRLWFKAFQKDHTEAHISCAGRGEEEQDALFFKKATRAVWTKSAHNYNAAIDIFCVILGSPDIYDIDWFNNVLDPCIPSWLTWYGRPGSPFYELPHVEIAQWKASVLDGTFKLVEKKQG